MTHGFLSVPASGWFAKTFLIACSNLWVLIFLFDIWATETERVGHLPRLHGEHVAGLGSSPVCLRAVFSILSCCSPPAEPLLTDASLRFCPVYTPLWKWWINHWNLSVKKVTKVCVSYRKNIPNKFLSFLYSLTIGSLWNLINALFLLYTLNSLW